MVKKTKHVAMLSYSDFVGKALPEVPLVIIKRRHVCKCNSELHIVLEVVYGLIKTNTSCCLETRTKSCQCGEIVVPSGGYEYIADDWIDTTAKLSDYLPMSGI
ncbi:hypothetical protein DFR44_11345 [Hydromonas duriensis]|uniref:Uncharacterized protein n=1 Tax=Hydromonas duriensis TaxID=1527608 RepID=A0A4R6Y6J4_9BURK|nr:hypothetical protein DFR44_11345 [Hydromonas duriensis]